jgi:hypothetical protein
MHTQSLIRLFEYCKIDYTDAQQFAVQRAKRQINAEFSLEESGIITLDGISYNKGDILQELDRPDFWQRLPHHITLWQHKSLLNLLERDAIAIEDVDESFLSLADDSAFVAFISPWMAPAFNNIMRVLLKTPDFYNANLWLNVCTFILPEDEESAFQSLRIFLEEQLRFFKNLNRDNFSNRYAAIAPWKEQEWYLLFNNLPDLLYYFNDEFAHVLINFTVQVQHNAKTLCLAISKGLMQMNNVSYHYKKLIEENHEIYEANVATIFNAGNNYSGSRRPVRKRSHTGWIATAIIFIIIRLLLAAKTCHSKSQHSHLEDTSCNTPAATSELMAGHPNFFLKCTVTVPC